MKHLRLTILTGACLLMSGGAFAQDSKPATPVIAAEALSPTEVTSDMAFDRKMEAFQTALEALMESGNATQETYMKLLNDFAGKFDPSSMTAKQIGELNDSGLMMNPALREPAQQRLASFTDEPNAEGAQATMLMMELENAAAWEKAQMTGQMPEIDWKGNATTLMAHPGFDDAVRSGAINPLQSLRMMDEADKKELKPQLMKMDRFLTDDTDPKFAMGLTDWFDTLAAMYEDQTDPELQDLRVKMHTFAANAQKRAAADESMDERMVDYMDSVTAYLDSDIAKGKFMGHEAPDIDFVWASEEGIENLDDLKGNVVVLDFWATWCGPCVGSFPQVRELQAHYEGYPVKIIGLTSVQGNIVNMETRETIDVDTPEEEFELMKEYMTNMDMTWMVAFSKQDVFNPMYGIRGIPHVTIIDAEGKVRYNGLHPMSPLEEKTEKINKLLKEADLAGPFQKD